MNTFRTFLPALLFSATAATATAQVGVALAPSGQPALAAIRPTFQNALPLAVVEVAGNPAFQLRAMVVTPAVPVGAPIFLLIGTPAAAPIPLGAPLLNPAYGLPGNLAMSHILVMAPMTVAGTQGTPPYSLPIPPGLGALGLTLVAQIVVWTPGGWGLTGATGIVI